MVPEKWELTPGLSRLVAVFLASTAWTAAQEADALKPYIKESSPVLVLEHARVIDGTGAAPREDQRIVIEGGKITRVEDANLKHPNPSNAKVLDLSGKTVIPGLVGMHEHLFYTTPKGGPGRLLLFVEMADSAPKLYLAGGVTTARTGGSMEPYTDLNLKAMIDAGRIPGPKLHITGPYLGGYLGRIPQMHTLTGPDDAARTVDYWAAEGVTSFKAYMDITSDELKTAIEHAHAKGLKVTGHICAVGFREAAALGIDNLEHGIVVDTEFFPEKKPGICPDNANEGLPKDITIDSVPVQQTIRDLVSHHVAITSTLAVFEVGVPNRPSLIRQNARNAIRLSEILTPEALTTYLLIRNFYAEGNFPDTRLLKMEMQFEREFVKAGGLLLAGCDPTSYGGVVPGYCDQRELELLVEAGFTPVEAIHIATQNGAIFLGEDASIGTVTVGKSADLVVIAGNPAQKMEDVENVEMVFKDGVGYDPEKLIKSAAGLVGLR
jgi:imidazolonepropionase-like amidohydrolase